MTQEAQENFRRTIAALDAIHAEDPAKDASGVAQELRYAQRMSARLEMLAPRASDALKLAVRCQHLRRWSMARGAYPAGKVGYLRWRKDSAIAHAVLAGEALGQAGCGADTVQRVQSLVRKERVKQDPEAQLLEDCACLVFLEFDFAAFALKHGEQKLIDILRKTWAKMSPAGRDAALTLELAPPLRALMRKALVRA